MSHPLFKVVLNPPHLDESINAIGRASHEYFQRTAQEPSLDYLVTSTGPVSYTHLTLPTNREV